MELNEHAVYYVRAAIFRGMAQVKRDIETAEEYLATGPAATFREMTENMIAYNQQMLREMEQYIPEELR